MPTILLKHIYYVSSEDKNYPASNLLSAVEKKWKCKENGEKSVYVIFELEEPTVITGIDIGNEHSAYVQVMVNKKGGKDSDYEELLLTSSFMTPLESRNSTNPNRVRIFSETTLVGDIAEKKWNLVKVICTQPYNKHTQYGLSFIKLHGNGPTTSSQSSNSSTGSRVIQLGKFKMREESPETSDSDTLTSTSLFTKWKNTSFTTCVKETAASEIKKASTALIASASPSFINRNKISDKKNTSISLLDTDDGEAKASKKSRNMNRLFYDDEEDDVVPTERLEKKLEKDKLAKDKEKVEREKELKVQKDKKDLKPSPQSKRTGEEKMKNSVAKFKTFLDDKNDDRKPSTSVTSNTKQSTSASPSSKPTNSSSSSKNKERDNRTPKRHSSSSPPKNQPSDSKKQKLSIEPKKTYKPFNKLMEGITLAISGIQNPERSDLRQKALDMGARYKPDWDPNCTHLICAFKGTPKYNQVKQDNGKIVSKKWIHESHEKRIKFPWRQFALDSYDQKLQDSDEEIYDEKFAPKKSEASTIPSSQTEENDSNILDMYDNSPQYDSGEDTEEEIERVKRESTTTKAVTELNNNVVDHYDLSTDDELNPNSQSSQTNQAFFKGIKFHLKSDTISSTDLIKLKHLIKVYQGELCENEIKSDYIISNKRVNIPNGFVGEIIKPLWIMECHDMESKLPIRRYKFDS